MNFYESAKESLFASNLQANNYTNLKTKWVKLVLGGVLIRDLLLSTLIWLKYDSIIIWGYPVFTFFAIGWVWSRVKKSWVEKSTTDYTESVIVDESNVTDINNMEKGRAYQQPPPPQNPLFASTSNGGGNDDNVSLSEDST